MFPSWNVRFPIRVARADKIRPGSGLNTPTIDWQTTCVGGQHASCSSCPRWSSRRPHRRGLRLRRGAAARRNRRRRDGLPCTLGRTSRRTMAPLATSTFVDGHPLTRDEHEWLRQRERERVFPHRDVRVQPRSDRARADGLAHAHDADALRSRPIIELPRRRRRSALPSLRIQNAVTLTTPACAPLLGSAPSVQIGSQPMASCGSNTWCHDSPAGFRRDAHQF